MSTPIFINIRRAAARRWVMLLLTLAVGCSFGPKLQYAPVSGRVTQGGRPLRGVTVTFYPTVEESTEQLPVASGKTDATGTYTLQLKNGKPGALVGKNKVVVNWPAPEPRSEPTPLGPPIPLEYTTVVNTPFEFEVKPGDHQQIDLPLP